MTNGPLIRARRTAYQAFYRLPVRWRRRLVRLGTTKYVVGAVVLVHTGADLGDGELLLLRQVPGRGWSLPAGLLGRDEPPVLAAQRELAEETGIRLDLDRFTAAQPNAVVHTNGRWIDVVFLAQVPARIEAAVDGAEVIEAAWHPSGDLPVLSGPTARLLSHYALGPLAASSTG